jgi:hypothetical protein
MVKLLHGVFALLLLAAVVSAAPFNEDDWVEETQHKAEPLHAIDSHMSKEEAMLTVAERYENGSPMNTLLVEHIASLTKDDIRKAVTETAHETGLIHYQFAQQEIEAQVQNAQAALKAISDTLTATSDFLIDKAIVAGAYVADAAGKDAAAVEKLIAGKKAEFVKMANAQIAALLGTAATKLKDAILLGIAKVLLFLATLDPTGGGGTVVALMKKIDAAGKAIGELAKKTADGVALKAEKLQLPMAGAIGAGVKALASEVQDAAKAANLEMNLAKLIGKVAVPLFCKEARSMAYVILDKQRVKEAYEQANPPDQRAKAMKVAGWAQDAVAMGTAHLILFSENYLPECVDLRQAACVKDGAAFKKKVDCKGKFKIDCEAYDKKCPKDAAVSYTAPKKWVGIKESK